MNESRLIGGIVCLALAVLIVVLTFGLPPGRMVFTVGEANVPILRAIILAIVGLALLITARESRKQDITTPAEGAQAESAEASEKAVLNKRLETMAWGCFLIMLGGFSFVPSDQVPKGVWSIGVGAIMLGLNLARYSYQIKMSGFTTFLGVVSLISGVMQLLGMHTLEGAVLLIVLGAYVIAKPWFDKRPLFGKAEEG
jgi:hypothetical protein